jgi:hypothetical protein
MITNNKNNTMKYEVCKLTVRDEDGQEFDVFDLDCSGIADDINLAISDGDAHLCAIEEDHDDGVYIDQRYTAHQILDFIRDHKIQWETFGHPSEDDAYIEYHNYENSTIFCSYPWDNRESVNEGVMFIMDMHYQKQAEDNA